MSVCSAPGYFSRQNKRAEKLLEQVIATDPSHLVFNQGSPRDDDTEPVVNKHVEKMSCQVLKFNEIDDDAVKVPLWMLQRLCIREGQPLCVQIHRKPG